MEYTYEEAVKNMHDFDKRIEEVNSVIEVTEDSDLLDAYMYEIKSLESFRKYWYNKAQNKAGTKLD